MSYSSKRVKVILIGTQFGDLTVIGEAERFCTGKTTRAMYPCQCKCGNKTKITGSQLRIGKRTRCSTCAYRERPQSTERYSSLERSFNIHVLISAKKRGIKCDLTLEEYEKIITKDCYYCGEKPRKIDHLLKNKIALREDFYANGVDRMDSSKGYTKDNCVPCCPQCNKMKMTYSIKDFLNKIKIIYEKWIKQEDIIKVKIDTN